MIWFALVGHGLFYFGFRILFSILIYNWKFVAVWCVQLFCKLLVLSFSFIFFSGWWHVHLLNNKRLQFSTMPHRQLWFILILCYFINLLTSRTICINYTCRLLWCFLWWYIGNWSSLNWFFFSSWGGRNDSLFMFHKIFLRSSTSEGVVDVDSSAPPEVHMKIQINYRINRFFCKNHWPFLKIGED